MSGIDHGKSHDPIRVRSHPNGLSGAHRNGSCVLVSIHRRIFRLLPGGVVQIECQLRAAEIDRITASAGVDDHVADGAHTDAIYVDSIVTRSRNDLNTFDIH